MCYKDFVDYIIPIIGLIVSIVACVYTCLTYRKSRDILEVVDEERKYRWNQKELETLFSTIPIDAIERFFEVPDIIRNELWEGLRAVDLRTFQYNGKERELIVKFVLVYIAPPNAVALLPVNVPPLIVAVPALYKTPPFAALLFVAVTLFMVIVPAGIGSGNADGSPASL